jgi:hypothetical protein
MRLLCEYVRKNGISGSCITRPSSEVDDSLVFYKETYQDWGTLMTLGQGDVLTLTLWEDAFVRHRLCEHVIRRKGFAETRVFAVPLAEDVRNELRVDGATHLEQTDRVLRGLAVEEGRKVYVSLLTGENVGLSYELAIVSNCVSFCGFLCNFHPDGSIKHVDEDGDYFCIDDDVHGLFQYAALRRHFVCKTAWARVRRYHKVRQIALFWNELTAVLMEPGGRLRAEDELSFAECFA